MFSSIISYTKRRPKDKFQTARPNTYNPNYNTSPNNQSIEAIDITSPSKAPQRPAESAPLLSPPIAPPTTYTSQQGVNRFQLSDSPRVQLDIQFNEEPITDWLGSAFANERTSPYTTPPRTSPRPSERGKRKEGEEVANKPDESDNIVSPDTDDILTDFEALNASRLARNTMTGIAITVSNVPETSTRSTEHSSNTVPKKAAPTPIKIPNAALHVPRAQILRTAELRTASTSSPMLSSGVSGATLARALMANVFVFSPSELTPPPRHRSTLVRADSEVLPPSDKVWDRRRANASTPGTGTRTSPPIPPRDDSMWGAALATARSGSKDLTWKTDPILPHTDDRPDAASHAPKSHQISRISEIPSPPETPFEPTTSPQPSSGSLYSESSMPNAGGNTQQRNSVGSGHPSPALFGASPSPSQRSTSDARSSGQEYDAVLDYYSLEQTPPVTAGIINQGFRPEVSPIMEESPSQLSPGFSNRTKHDSRRSELSLMIPISPGSSSQQNGKAKRQSQRPSSDSRSSKALLLFGDKPTSQFSSIGAPAESSSITRTSVSAAVLKRADSSATTSSLSDSGRPSNEPRNRTSGYGFTRRRSGSAPSPITVVRNPEWNSYRITMTPGSGHSNESYSESSPRPDHDRDQDDDDLGHGHGEESGQTDQTFPETPSAFSPMWSPNDLPLVRNTSFYMMLPNTPPSALERGSSLGGGAAPSISQQVLIARSSNSLRAMRGGASGGSISRRGTLRSRASVRHPYARRGSGNQESPLREERSPPPLPLPSLPSTPYPDEVLSESPGQTTGVVQGEEAVAVAGVEVEVKPAAVTSEAADNRKSVEVQNASRPPSVAGNRPPSQAGSSRTDGNRRQSTASVSRVPSPALVATTTNTDSTVPLPLSDTQVPTPPTITSPTLHTTPNAAETTPVSFPSNDVASTQTGVTRQASATSVDSPGVIAPFMMVSSSQTPGYQQQFSSLPDVPLEVDELRYRFTQYTMGSLGSPPPYDAIMSPQQVFQQYQPPPPPLQQQQQQPQMQLPQPITQQPPLLPSTTTPGQTPSTGVSQQSSPKAQGPHTSSNSLDSGSPRHATRETMTTTVAGAASLTANATTRPLQRVRPPLPGGPRRPSSRNASASNPPVASAGMAAMYYPASSRDRNGSISSINSSMPNTGNIMNTTTIGGGGGGGGSNTGIRRVASTVSGPRFQTPAPKWRGHTMDAAKWTFTSAQLQAIVSRAIKQSSEASSIRLLRLETIDRDIPEEMRKLEMQRTDVKTRYKMFARRRAHLVESLTMQFDGTEPLDTGLSLRLVEDMKGVSAMLDVLVEELHSVDEQIGQLRSLCDVHSASALAMALRKLNASFLKELGENKGLRERIDALEAERDEAWKQAENVANDYDVLSEKLDVNSPVSASPSNRSSRVLAVRKSSIRVSKAGLRSSGLRSQRSSVSSVHRTSMLAVPSSARTNSMQEEIPPVPPIPRQRPADIATDLAARISRGLSTDGYTPTSESRALLRAQEDLYELLGISIEDKRVRRTRSVIGLPGDSEPPSHQSPLASRPNSDVGTSTRPASLPSNSHLSEVYHVMTADRNAMLATLDMLADD